MWQVLCPSLCLPVVSSCPLLYSQALYILACISWFLCFSSLLPQSCHLFILRCILLFGALIRGTWYIAGQPVGEVAFSSGLHLSHLAMGRDVELHIKNHKRAMVMTGSLHGIRKEWSWAKGSQHSSWYHCQPKQIVLKVGYCSDQVPG